VLAELRREASTQRNFAAKQRRQADLDRWAAMGGLADAALQRTRASDERMRAARAVHQARTNGDSNDRERLADQRDSIADERDKIADEREATADERERVAEDRQRLADKRDRDADRRDRLADQRDAIADERDRIASEDHVRLLRNHNRLIRLDAQRRREANGVPNVDPGPPEAINGQPA
jgi:hypothetical protein